MKLHLVTQARAQSKRVTLETTGSTVRRDQAPCNYPFRREAFRLVGDVRRTRFEYGRAMDMSALLTSILVALIGAAYVAIAILALVQILRSPNELILKAMWVAVVIIAPFLGSVAWFFLGRNHGHRLSNGRMG